MTEHVKLLLVNLESREFPAKALPLALPTLGGAFLAKLGSYGSVAYFDEQISGAESFESVLTEVDPHIVAISAQFGSTDSLWGCLRTCRRVLSDTCIIVGNLLATYAAADICRAFPEVLCCIGRGEETLVELARLLLVNGTSLEVPNLAWIDSSGNVVHSSARAVPETYVVAADWSGYAQWYPLTIYDEVWLESSRGCPQKRNDVGCTYCAILPEAGSRDWRPRPLALVIEELAVVAQLGVPHVRFADEEFMANQPIRAIELARAIAELPAQLPEGVIMPTFDVAMRVDDVVRPNPAHDRVRENHIGDQIVTESLNALRRRSLMELRQCGLRQVYLGIESGSLSQLKRMRKGVTPSGDAAALSILREINIQAACGWILLDPFLTSLDDLDESLAFIDENDLIPSSLSDNFVTDSTNEMRVLVGTPLVKQVFDAGLLRERMPNLLEYRFAYASTITSLIAGLLRRWKHEVDQRQLYAIKTQVAHDALSDAANPANDVEAFFAIKRLDFDVCAWVVRTFRQALEDGNDLTEICIPRRFYDARAAYLAGPGFPGVGEVSTSATSSVRS